MHLTKEYSTKAHILDMTGMPQSAVIKSMGLVLPLATCVILDMMHTSSSFNFLTCEMGITLVGLVWGLYNISKMLNVVPGTGKCSRNDRCTYYYSNLLNIGTGIKHGFVKGPNWQLAYELHELGVSSLLGWALKVSRSSVSALEARVWVPQGYWWKGNPSIPGTSFLV